MVGHLIASSLAKGVARANGSGSAVGASVTEPHEDSTHFGASSQTYHSCRGVRGGAD